MINITEMFFSGYMYIKLQFGINILNSLNDSLKVLDVQFYEVLIFMKVQLSSQAFNSFCLNVKNPISVG